MKLMFLKNLIDSEQRRKERVKKLYHKLLEGDSESIPSATKKLEKIDHPLVLYASVRLLEHPYSDVREWAINEIERRRNYMENPAVKKEIYKKLTEYLNSKDDYVREAAVAVLNVLSK